MSLKFYRVPSPLLVSSCLIANFFCSIVDILLQLGKKILVSSGNMFGQFGKERRKNEIESDLHENQHQMRVES